MKRPETTYNDRQRARNDVKRPTMKKKQSETTWSDSEMTWNNLQQTRKNLKDLQRTDSNFMEPFYLKSNQLEGSNGTKKQ